jgi:uroporphyrinogen-III synthase
MSDTSATRPHGPREPIVLTRSVEDCASWAASLRERGIESIALPCIAAEAIQSNALRTSLADALTKADWLVFTSQRGAAAVAALAGSPLPAQLRIATVGAATGQKAHALFGRVDFVADDANAAGLARELAEHLASTHSLIVLALAANAGNALADALREAGHRCQRFDLYRTVPVPPRSPRRTLADIGSHTVFLASPSAVVGFFNQVEIDPAARLISIGPSTSAAIQKAGMKVYAQAQSPGLEGLLEVVED